MFQAMTAVFFNDNTLYWLIYQITLFLFFIIFIFIYQRGRREFRPLTHHQFERLRIGCVLAVLFNIIWTLQFIVKHTKTVWIIFGSLSDTLFAVILCTIASHIIQNYFALKFQGIPYCIIYYLYSWFCITFITIICQLLSYSLQTTFSHHLYTYSIYIDIAFNVTFVILLIYFIVLFSVWTLIQYHRISFISHKESDEYRTPSDLTTGGEQDTAQTFLLRFIGLLCGFCVYIGFVVAYNIYTLHSRDSASYDVYQILMYLICKKLVLLLCLAVYLLPSTDEYLSVNPHILDALNVNAESNRKKISTFKDPNASDKWSFHASRSAGASSRNDTGLFDEDKDDWDKDSEVSHTTLMFRYEQRKHATTSASKVKAKNWLTWFSPYSSHQENASDDRYIRSASR